MSTVGQQTMQQSTNSAIAKELNNTSEMRSSSLPSTSTSSLTQNSSQTHSNSALRNDVKLSEYSDFAPCYATIRSHPQQMQNGASSSNSSITATGSIASATTTNDLHSQSSHSQSNSNDTGHLSKLFGDDDASMLLNNNNNKSIIQNPEHSTNGGNQLPSTPQSGRMRNSLMSDINFSPVNGILSLSNTSGE